MKLFEKFNTIFLKNRMLIFFILDEIKQCVPQKKWDAYYEQINCINKVQWVLDKEADLYYDKNCFLKNVFDNHEEKIATVTVYDLENKQYILDVYTVNGKIFSIESAVAFRNLLISNIQTLEVKCIKYR
jgi:hypothetical protein